MNNDSYSEESSLSTWGGGVGGLLRQNYNSTIWQIEQRHKPVKAVYLKHDLIGRPYWQDYLKNTFKKDDNTVRQKISRTQTHFFQENQEEER